MAQAETGDIQGALATASRIENTCDRAWTLMRISVVQAEVGDIQGAPATAQAIGSGVGRARALAKIAVALAKSQK